MRQQFNQDDEDNGFGEHMAVVMAFCAAFLTFVNFYTVMSQLRSNQLEFQCLQSRIQKGNQ